MAGVTGGGVAKDIHNLMKNIASFSGGQATVNDINYESDGSELMTVRIIPNDGLYRGGMFDFELDLSPYPDSAPGVTCLTKIFHPNIDSESTSSNICVSLLDSEWTSDCTLEDVVQGILFLFYNPNLEDPLSGWFDSSDMDYEEFAKNVSKSLQGGTVHDDLEIQFEKNCYLELESEQTSEEIISVIMEDLLASVEALAFGESTVELCNDTDIDLLNLESTDKSENDHLKELIVVSRETTLINIDETELSTLNDIENTMRKKDSNDFSEQALNPTSLRESELANEWDGHSGADCAKLLEKTFCTNHRSRHFAPQFENFYLEMSLMTTVLPKIVKYLFCSVFLRCKKSDSLSR